MQKRCILSLEKTQLAVFEILPVYNVVTENVFSQKAIGRTPFKFLNL